MTMKLILVLSFIGYSYAVSISEYNNEVHISAINGMSHGEIGVYPNHRGEEAVLTYHTDDTIACSHLRINVYRGQQKDSNNLISSLCNDDVTETSTEGFLIVFDSDNSVHNGVINLKISAPNGVSFSSSIVSGK